MRPQPSTPPPRSWTHNRVTGKPTACGEAGVPRDRSGPRRSGIVLRGDRRRRQLRWWQDRRVRYRERAAPVAGTVLWQRSSGGAPEGTPIMPDGCLDLVWDGRRLFVAGPDTAVRWHQGQAGTTYVGLRFSGGVGPVQLGMPADEVRDRTPNLDELWPAREARVLTERVEAQPSVVLESWAVEASGPGDALRTSTGGDPRWDALGSGGGRVSLRRPGTPHAGSACPGRNDPHGTAARALHGGQYREQIDRATVGIQDDRVAHTPKGVPRLQVALVSSSGQVFARPRRPRPGSRRQTRGRPGVRPRLGATSRGRRSGWSPRYPMSSACHRGARRPCGASRRPSAGHQGPTGGTTPRWSPCRRRPTRSGQGGASWQRP